VGFDVKEAASGEEAIALWREWQPQLIWMDKRMPGMDGLETTRRIREEELQRDGKRVPIIALSASALEHERDEILASGCDDFVPKPFREGTIFSKMAERLGVSFVYDEPTEVPARSGAGSGAAGPVLTPERLAVMPAVWISDMRRAVTTGNTRKATGLTDELELRDAPLANELRAMIRRYDLDALDALLAAAGAARPPA
jgi:CheY-like chemotaxis protein